MASRCRKPRSELDYLDEDTILFGTDFGKDGETNSGYARIVKAMEARHADRVGAVTVHEGKLRKTCWSGAGGAAHAKQGRFALVVRARQLLRERIFRRSRTARRASCRCR